MPQCVVFSLCATALCLYVCCGERSCFHLCFQSQNLLDTYAELVGPEAGKEDFLRLAQHYQSVGNPLDAGRFYLKAKEYATVSLSLCECT